MKWLTPALIIFLSASAHAAKNVIVLDTFEAAVQAQSVKLAQMPKVISNPKCENRYSQMWADGSLKIDLYYGYIGSDDGKVTADRLLRYTFIQSLMKPCSPGLNACDFKMVDDQSDSDGAYVLEKPVTKPNGETGNVILRVWDSAVNNWTADNTIGIDKLFITNQRQAKKTNQIWKQYLGSYQTADVVIYNGHSEIGTGPGFGPMGYVQYTVGQIAKPNYTRWIEGLKRIDHRPQAVMIAACESKKYYAEKLHELLPSTAIAVTKESELFLSGEQVVYSFIDSLLVGRCEEEMNQTFIPTGSADAGMHISGFDN